MRFNSARRSAFSLIELSIVLIIIGLLIAGVTGGASLIKSSELRSVITESRTWSVSVNSFFNQFDNLPGDYSGTLGLPAGGDGDGRIEFSNAGAAASDNSNFEGRNAWRQLSITNILDSSVVYSTSNNTGAVPTNPITTGLSSFGDETPSSKIGSAGWDFDYNTTTGHNVVVATGTIASSNAPETNTLVNGTVVSSGVITPTDALSLDSKYDDGASNAGSIQGIGTDCIFNTSQYKTIDSDEQCALSFRVDVNS